MSFFISIIASSIAKGKSQDEINIMSTFFSQLGDTLATIVAFDSSCSEISTENQAKGSVTIDSDKTDND